MSSATVETAPAHKTILLVEDQEGVRGLILLYFGKRGFHLIEAANGQEALDLAEKRTGNIDVLITDVSMPGLDGVALSQKMKSGRPKLKTLFMSGLLTSTVEELTAPGSGSVFMQKPFRIANLFAKVQELTGEAIPAAGE